MIPRFKIIAAARLQAQDGRHQNFQSSKGIPCHPLVGTTRGCLILFLLLQLYFILLNLYKSLLSSHQHEDLNFGGRFCRHHLDWPLG